MEIKVKEVGGTDQKSVQEIERELVENHQEKFNEGTPQEGVTQPEEVVLKV